MKTDKRLRLANAAENFSVPAEQDKPIHIPFGNYRYNDRIVQSFDRAHAEIIAQELNAKVAAGNPGIPVYQGHPDVPALAAKYPDKGALGWIVRIELTDAGVDLFVDWDRFPGQGFKWFSPYWFGPPSGCDASGSRIVVVDHIESVGLVNNPNIAEFRLPNEAAGSEFKLPNHLVALAKRFDERMALANVVDANGAGHGDDGRFDGSGSGGASQTPQKSQQSVAAQFKAAAKKASNDPAAMKLNDALKAARKAKDGAGIARAHMQALKAGMVWDKSIKGYRPPVAK